MADFYPVLSRAVTALASNTPDARRAVYERARAALVKQLRGIDPPLSEADITRERLQLEDAIRRIEAEARAAAVPAPRSPAPAGRPAHGGSPTGAETVRHAVTEADALGRAAANAQQVAVGVQAAFDGEPAPPASATRLEPRFNPHVGDDGDDDRAPMQAGPRIGRPRGAPAAPRPAARRNRAEEEAKPSGRSRLAVAAAVGVVLLLGGAGAGAYVAREEIAAFFGVDPIPSGGGSKPKIADRVGADPAPAAPAAGTTGGDTVPKTAAADPAPAGDAPAAAGNAGTPAEGNAPAAGGAPADTTAFADPRADGGTTQPDAAAGDGGPAVRSPAGAANVTTTTSNDGLVVAQRAILYEEAPDKQGGTAIAGSVAWRTESGAGNGGPPEIELHGDVTVPDRNTTVNIVIRRNADATLPASHTIEIKFNLPQNFPNAGVANVPGLLMKPTEEAGGAPLKGMSVRVTTGFFLIGLDNNDPDKTLNIQLLRDRGWIDIPILYENGRRAVLTLEKGAPGERAVKEALQAWAAAPTAAAQ